MDDAKSDSFILCLSDRSDLNSIKAVFSDCEEIIDGVYRIVIDGPLQIATVLQEIRARQSSYHPFVLIAPQEGGLSIPPNS